MSGQAHSKGGIFRFLIDNSLLLVIGAVAALIWANWADRNQSSSYYDFVHFDVRTLWGGGGHHDGGIEPIAENAAAANGGGTSSDGLPLVTESAEGDHGAGQEADSGHHWYTLSFIVNDILMALFFAIAAKEVWESLLPGGALSNPRKAATPLLATLGGILGPVLFYLAGAYATGTQAELGQGWAVPCATDIAFSYLIARIIFGPGHPAIAFLLLLAIADDAAGLMILAVFYPSAPIEPLWFLLTVAAIALALLLRKLKVHSHWFYILGPGVICWFSFYQSHIHAALGLVPIIPLLPSASSDLGIFAKEELQRDDTLNEFEHFWKTPVECFLGLFGLVNAGVVLSSVGTGTWLVLVGLLLGKPLGITAMTLLAEKGFRLEKPAGMDYRHVITLGMVAGIGFTVALFVSVAAFKVPGATQDSVKMGALLSFAAAPLAIIIARVLKVRPCGPIDLTPDGDADGAGIDAD
jgi:NhaA family Na+:H+ antiporter